MPWDTTKFYPQIYEAIKKEGFEADFPLTVLHKYLISIAKLQKEKTREEHIKNMILLGDIEIMNEKFGTFPRVPEEGE